MQKSKDMTGSPKKEKLTEKAFVQSMAVSVFGILLCIVALTTATWAWFSEGVSSNSNNIRSANCEVEVTVSVKDGDEVVPTSENGTYTYTTFTNDTSYTVTIEATGTAENAYCILDIDGSEYYTAQIPTTPTVIDGETVPNYITFTLKFSANNIPEKIQIQPCWGTYSQKPITFENDKTYTDPQKSTSDGTGIAGDAVPGGPGTTDDVVPPVSDEPGTPGGDGAGTTEPGTGTSGSTEPDNSENEANTPGDGTNTPGTTEPDNSEGETNTPGDGTDTPGTTEPDNSEGETNTPGDAYWYDTISDLLQGLFP